MLKTIEELQNEVNWAEDEWLQARSAHLDSLTDGSSEDRQIELYEVEEAALEEYNWLVKILLTRKDEE